MEDAMKHGNEELRGMPAQFGRDVEKMSEIGNSFGKIPVYGDDGDPARNYEEILESQKHQSQPSLDREQHDALAAMEEEQAAAPGEPPDALATEEAREQAAQLRALEDVPGAPAEVDGEE